MNGEFVTAMEDVLDLYAEPHDSIWPVVCIDKQRRPAISSNCPVRNLMAGRYGACQFIIGTNPSTSYPQQNQTKLGNPGLEDEAFKEDP